jgi:hypothetical protein
MGATGFDFFKVVVDLSKEGLGQWTLPPSLLPFV